MIEGAGAARAREWEHTALAVHDLDRAIMFYREAFGYEVDFENRGVTDRMQKLVGLRSVECDLAQLHSPISGHVLELITFRNVPPGSEEHGPTRAGFGHLSFVVDDLDSAVAAVERLGGSRLGDITPFNDDRRVYCRDPSGTVVELAEQGERE